MKKCDFVELMSGFIPEHPKHHTPTKLSARFDNAITIIQVEGTKGQWVIPMRADSNQQEYETIVKDLIVRFVKGEQPKQTTCSSLIPNCENQEIAEILSFQDKAQRMIEKAKQRQHVSDQDIESALQTPICQLFQSTFRNGRLRTVDHSVSRSPTICIRNGRHRLTIFQQPPSVFQMIIREYRVSGYP